MVNITDFSYSYVKEHGFYRPKIPVIVSAGGLKTEVVGLIDSGSDYVLFPREIADAVGIELRKKSEEAQGIGGKIKVRSGLVTITLKKGTRSKILQNMMIHVQEDERGIDEILLGRDPFFKYFKIEFDDNSRRVVLRPNRRPLKTS